MYMGLHFLSVYFSSVYIHSWIQLSVFLHRYMEIDLQFFRLLEALDELIHSEAVARRLLVQDELLARPRPLYHMVSDVHTDLWSRHRAQKNQYGVRNGRRVVAGHVFVRRNAPWWCDDTCYYCLSDHIVCRDHEFVLHGRDAIRRYVENATQFDLWL